MNEKQQTYGRGDLMELLSEYSRKNTYPMHMPGHKRNPDFLQMRCPTALDITEIAGFDNLHAAEGILKAAMERAAKLWGAKRSFFLVNGASCGILAAIAAAIPSGGGIAMDRSAHKSAYHAVELRRLTPCYLRRQSEPQSGVFGSLSPEEAARVLCENPAVRGLFVTSPTYEGVVSNIAELAKAAHAHGAVLIVDEAHGAHLGFSPAFPPSAVTQGADIVIQSLHKTLPAFTQSAILHLCSDRIPEERLARFLSYYQTTSPSYLLMAGIDSCVSLLANRGAELFDAYEKRLFRFRRQAEDLVKIKLPDASAPMIWQQDPGKLYFSLRETDLTGEAFGQILREEFAIEPEMTTADGCLCMTSIADTNEGFERLAAALSAIDARLCKVADRSSVSLPAVPKMICTPATAAECAVISVPLSNAAGRIAGEFVWAYPPDIPLLVPGEQIESEMIAYLSTLQECSVRLHSDSKGLPNTLRVIQ